MEHLNDRQVIRRLLTTPARWAVVGLSSNESRPAFGVAKFLKESLGMQIVPVHPSAPVVHDEQGFTSLAEIPAPINVVDIFVRSELAGEVVDQAIASGAQAVWLQLGVIDEAAAQRATEAGLDVVMNTCPKIEWPRIQG